MSITSQHMKKKHNWKKIEIIIAVAIVVIIAIPAILVGLTDMKTGMAILGVMIKILEVMSIVAAVLGGVWLGWLTVSRIKENRK